VIRRNTENCFMVNPFLVRSSTTVPLL
jgi:hypothetical protein